MDPTTSLISVKWLGPGAINPLVVDGKGGKAELIPAVRRWVAAHGRNITLPGMPFPAFSADHPVMIVSYETLRSLQEELASCQIGLLLADEGHRLKNAGMSPASSFLADPRNPHFPVSYCTQCQAPRYPYRHPYPERPLGVLCTP